MATLLSIDAARERVLSALRPLGTEEVAIDDALDRVLAEDVMAAGDVPPFDNSAMDGFAVSAGPAGRRLKIVGESRAGAPASAPPSGADALRVSTGALLPSGTEAVIPIEQVHESDGDIVLDADAVSGRHIRRAGEDVAAGTVVLKAGTRLGPAELGVAAIAGRGSLTCSRRPAVALVATGDELVRAGDPLKPGQIHDSNLTTLAAMATHAGAAVLARAHAADSLEATRDALGAALEQADVLVVSGGVSVGPHDHVKPALEALGVEERFWRVALRPGKPTWFGVHAGTGTLVFGLPGNPVSAMVTFLLFARPALLALQGAPPSEPRRLARLGTAVPRSEGRDEAVRVWLRETDAGLKAYPTGPQGSHVLTSMLGADGLAIVPAGPGALPAGVTVEVELI
jgi:molybdopterin molybdotransferase